MSFLGEQHVLMWLPCQATGRSSENQRTRQIMDHMHGSTAPAESHLEPPAS